ncbi:MAG TPA: PSD1 and planctomycete cytochrome C domain-containing protein [Chthonomonadaceae bacterium]|nr:PSD1 and planctomycete cytochrome C domain-containing protein [Chthonomonadaceae bacterium]
MEIARELATRLSQPGRSGIGSVVFRLILACLIGVGGPASATSPAPPASKLDYLRDIRPLLAANCFPCHGQDDKKRQAGMRLDVREAAYGKSAEGHTAIVPGKPEASALYVRITSQDGLKMPPEGSGKKLAPAEVALLKRWIAQGAPYTPHWAFQPPVRPALPKGKHAAWVRNAVDAFVLARLEQEGLTPSPEADRYTLIRRLSLDLIGLPPTPQEVEAFVADRSPDAYEKVVDRLLASPRFGEKWARMWLDVARYADSAGYGSDPLRPNLWPYRDWVINAFNKDLPYDRFLIEQLAGDLLPNPTQEQMIATAFHRNTMTNTEGGTDREEFRTAAVKDRATTTAQAIMGLTLGCAQCHSHKFDPITNKEYYRFVAFFNQTGDNDQPSETPTLPVVSELQQSRMAALKAEIESLQKTNPMTPDAKAELEKKQKALAEIKPVNLPVMQELPKEKRRQSYVLVLGNFLNRAEPVDPGVPAAFPPMPEGAPMDRLGLAQWLVSPNNPLTARVAVNRLWAQLFGTGIVETEEDFGTQGALPTHPELLDWLAVTFEAETQESKKPGENPQFSPSPQRGVGALLAAPRGGAWNIKALLRLIVTSATYRQDSRVSPVALERDPRDRLLSRYPRRRLAAEFVRDQALALSGLLSDKMGGPSVFPPQPAGLWQAAFNGDRNYPTSTGEDRYRRGVYTFWRRTVPPPGMATFDAPSREICTFRRFPTNTPLQALVTLNDPAYVEMAQAMGRRIVKEGGPTVESRVRYGLRLALGRPPRDEQVKPLLALMAQEEARYRIEPEAAKKLATDPLGPLPAGQDPAEMAAWTVLSNVLLNLDAVLTNH